MTQFEITATFTVNASDRETAMQRAIGHVVEEEEITDVWTDDDEEEG